MPQHQTVLSLPGLCCATEVATVKEALSRLNGVSEVRCNLVTQTVRITLDPEATSELQVISTIERAGLRASLAKPAAQSSRTQQLHLISTIASGMFVVVGFICRFSGFAPWAQTIAFGAAIAAGGWFVVPKALAAARRLSPDMNLLMTLAIAGAIFINAWDEAGTVAFLFSLAELLESLSVTRARRAIKSLMDLAPDTALVKHGEQVEEQPVAEVRISDLIVIKPGARIPMDGEVVAGESSVNQAPITGEFMPAEKRRGSTVFAGTINERGSLEVRVTKLSTESTLSKIIHLVEEAQSQTSPAQRFVDVFARYYTPIVIVLAVLVAIVPPALFDQVWAIWFYRALVLLVVACPCALVISTPVSIVSALTAAARRGVLIKGGAALEMLGKVRVLAVDKTGTITQGRPRVFDVIGFNGAAPTEVIGIAAALETHSEHPLAQAIIEDAKQRGAPAKAAVKFQSITGKGVQGEIEGLAYIAGNRRLMQEIGAASSDADKHIESIEHGGQTAIVVARQQHAGVKGEILGVIAVGDTIRPQAANAIARLRGFGIRVVMLSGDNRPAAEEIARMTGIEEVVAELLPDQKVERVRALLTEQKYVGMLGDGINDAPALAAASVGIAMGVAGSDAALETADVALMADDLENLPDIIALGRRTERIIKFNVAFSILTKLAFLGLAGAGKVTMWLAIAADTGASLVVVANGLRLLNTIGHPPKQNSESK